MIDRWKGRTTIVSNPLSRTYNLQVLCSVRNKANCTARIATTTSFNIGSGNMVAPPIGTKTTRTDAVPLTSTENSLEVLIEIVSAELIPSSIKQLNPYCIFRRILEDIENNDNTDDGDIDNDGDSGGNSRKKNRTQKGSNGANKAKTLHQTSIIRQNNSPIWTIRTRSLYLLSLDHEHQELIQDNHKHRNKRVVHYQFDIMHKRYSNVGVVVGGADISIGIVTLTLDQLKNGDGSRIEMELKPKIGGDKISQERIAKVRSGEFTFWTDG